MKRREKRDGSGELRLYCDEARKWNLVQSDYTTARVRRLAYDNTLTSAGDSLDLNGDTYFDAAIIKYEYVNAAGNDVAAWDVYDPRPGGYAPKRVFTRTIEGAKPRAGAAKAHVNALRRRSRAISMTAVSDFTVSPGDQFAAALGPTTALQGGVISTVNWTSSDEMSISTRGGSEIMNRSWILRPSGTSWANAPAATWATAP